MQVKSIFISTGLLLLSLSSKADPWHGWVKVNHLYPISEGFNFMVDKALSSHSSCDNGKRFFISKDHDNYEAMVSTLLLAYVSRKEINMNLDERSEAICNPSINRFTVR